MLKERYPPPQYRIYGKEIREGYDAPCFFTEILDRGSRAETKNFAKGGFSVRITYFQTAHDYIGEYQDILQISIEIDYMENTRKEDTGPVAGEIGVVVTQG